MLLPLGFTRAADLVDPPIIASSDGLLNVTLTLEGGTHEEGGGFTMTTRMFNGILPGPTIRIRPGDVLKVNFRNNLDDQGVPYRHNTFSAPDESNLHFHGLHVSGELPSDDALLHLSPGGGYLYEIQVPFDHMPGTHWLHPHRHGSASLQVGGGAVAAVIVEDPVSFPLPEPVRNARDVVLVVMQMELDDLMEVAKKSNDNLLNITGAPSQEFVLTNGQINPTIRVDAGEWARLRVVFAGWQKFDLGMTINGCEMQLLAKDGIYIRNFPRAISEAPIVPGGRADIMLRCPEANQSFPVQGWGYTMATIVTSANTVDSTDLLSWTPPFPNYLSDLRSTPADCSCSTRLGVRGGDFLDEIFRDRTINNRRFQTDVILHSSPLGAVIERIIDADNHPYHQHVYPFQLVELQLQTQYNRLGDWHDSMFGSATVRYKAAAYAGKIMMHCHRLEHEDEGMMAMEYIDPDPTAPCTCGFRPAPPQLTITNAPIATLPEVPPASSPISVPIPMNMPMEPEIEPTPAPAPNNEQPTPAPFFATETLTEVPQPIPNPIAPSSPISVPTSMPMEPEIERTPAPAPNNDQRTTAPSLAYG